MELCLRDNDPSQTLLITPDGQQLYKIETPNKNSGNAVTVICRFEGRVLGHVASEIGKIESAPTGTMLSWCEGDTETILYHGIGPNEEHSWSFTADGCSYKWQIFIRYPVLFLDDKSHTLIARYRRAKLGIVSRSRRAFLEILPAGLNVIDLVVVTFVAFSKQYLLPASDLDSNDQDQST